MSTPRSRRDQFSAATRAALLDAATARFAEHGFAGTSLEDVAADIRATRGAVYHHFTSKKALFEAVFEKLETQAVRRSEDAGTAGADAWQSALLALDAYLDQCTDPVYGRIVWREAPIALGWSLWEELEEKFAFGLVERHVRALTALVAEPLPIEPATRIAFHMLGAAGMELAKAADDDKARVRAEYTHVLVRVLSGMIGRPGGT